MQLEEGDLTSSRYANITREHFILKEIAKHLDENAKVTFLTCESGRGAKGRKLKSYLQEVLGPNVEIILFERTSGWTIGGPGTVQQYWKSWWWDDRGTDAMNAWDSMSKFLPGIGGDAL